ncbi:MAG: ABC transporter ATP-binding protein [Clostridia bacterium]|nr:ABC transporter ATP-binding protein [Clostridia bacterium]
MESIIQARNINRFFKSGSERIHALKNVHVNIKAGTLTILKGRSGSGKTTLMNLLGALDRPDQGEIFFQNQDITKFAESKRDDLRRRQMGFVFQSVALIPLMSAYENVEFGLRVAGYEPQKRRARAEECLAFVGLQKRMGHRTHEMSGGEQQRVAIARAIAHRPEVIFADEPTAQLDTLMGLQVMKVFRDLVEKERLTIVMTSHDPNIIELADTIYELQDGQIMNESESGIYGG